MIFLYLQDVLEERFSSEYLFNILVAVGLLLITISLVVTTLYKEGVLIGMIFLYFQDVLEERFRHCGGSGAFAHYIPHLE